MLLVWGLLGRASCTKRDVFFFFKQPLPQCVKNIGYGITWLPIKGSIPEQELPKCINISGLGTELKPSDLNRIMLQWSNWRCQMIFTEVSRQTQTKQETLVRRWRKRLTVGRLDLAGTRKNTWVKLATNWKSFCFFNTLRQRQHTVD